MTGGDVTGTISRFVTTTRQQDLPPDVTERAKAYFLDWLGCALIGSQTDTGRMFLDLARETGGAPEATVVGGQKTSCLDAALVNGATSHELEFDDVHRASISHPGAPVIPAALAAAEREHSSGMDLLTAIVLGYDVSLRIGEGVNPSHYRYWHTTGTCGTFGAAAAAGRLLGLDEASMQDAMGNAGSQAAGLWEFVVDGAMTKVLHTGKAAMNGLLAALLAARGFTGATRILEGDRGFGKAMSEEEDLGVMTEGLGTHYKIREVGIKAYPCCGHTHTTVTAALELAERHGIQPAEIRKVRVRTYSTAIRVAGNPHPRTTREAKFSLAYCAMAAFRHRRVGLDQFATPLVQDKVIQELLERVELVADPELEAAYPAKCPAIVEVETVDGGLLVARADSAPGDPETPLSEEQQLAKFRDLASTALPATQIDEIIDRVGMLHEVADVSAVAPLFAAPRGSDEVV
jgi:2-methylcitrate dehydratase PrpD